MTSPNARRGIIAPWENAAWEQRQEWRSKLDVVSQNIKKELGPFAGLKYFQKGDCFVLISRHWPHLIPWSWFLALHKYRDGELRHFLRFRRNWNKRGWYLELLWLGKLGWHKQTDDWMVHEKYRHEAVDHV